jgi:hypothetical protein
VKIDSIPAPLVLSQLSNEQALNQASFESVKVAKFCSLLASMEWSTGLVNEG